MLFLDELNEFKPSVLDALREPLESGEITVSRANYRVKFPAMNPCPCGNASDPHHECRCTDERINRYLGKLSGPLLDRIDLVIEVPALSQVELLAEADNDQNWGEVRSKINLCRESQTQRAGKLNCDLHLAELKKYCHLDEEQRAGLANIMDKLSLSARATHRVIKMARTIADFDGRAGIGECD